ncbi:MAG: N-acetylmuramoyl-L-alanine amidase [Kiritimatiellia bacterium]|nr:N-acetylmuramoyl-L-alanine amidase [Lentisphaerota bacterium]
MTLQTRLRISAAWAGMAFLAVAPLTASAANQGLNWFARRHGFTDFQVRDRTIVMARRFHSFELMGNSRQAQYNGTTIWLNHPVQADRGGWVVSDTDAENTLLALAFPHRRLQQAGYGLVVLDAGHGGHDKGAVSPRQVEEKRVNLYLARRVQHLLQQQGVRVRLTREDDRYLTLEERCARAASWKGDLFVSIHMNSAASRSAQGIETHIMPPAGAPVTADSRVTERDRLSYPGNRFDAANMLLGYNLQNNMLRATRAQDRGVRRSRFYVLRNSPCPAALVEGGFISNPEEEHNIIQQTYRDKLAEGITKGILDYLNVVRQARTGR